jgi:hypothetical protein
VSSSLVANNASDKSNLFTGVANTRFDAGSGTNFGLLYDGVYSRSKHGLQPTSDTDGGILKRSVATGLQLVNTGSGTDVQISFLFENSANVAFNLTASSAPYRLTLNQKYHIVGVYDGTTAILYVNGVEAVRTTSVGVGGIRSTPTIPPSISSARVGSWPQAVIDEVAWYPSALSAARVLAHYNAGVASGYDATIDVATPVSHWKLGETGQATDRKGVLNLSAVNGPVAGYGNRSAV